MTWTQRPQKPPFADPPDEGPVPIMRLLGPVRVEATTPQFVGGDGVLIAELDPGVILLRVFAIPAVAAFDDTGEDSQLEIALGDETMSNSAYWGVCVYEKGAGAWPNPPPGAAGQEIRRGTPESATPPSRVNVIVAGHEYLFAVFWDDAGLTEGGVDIYVLIAEPQ